MTQAFGETDTQEGFVKIVDNLSVEFYEFYSHNNATQTQFWYR